MQDIVDVGMQMKSEIVRDAKNNKKIVAGNRPIFFWRSYCPSRFRLSVMNVADTGSANGEREEGWMR